MNIFLNNSGQIIYALLRIFMFSEDNNIYILSLAHSVRSLSEEDNLRIASSGKASEILTVMSWFFEEVHFFLDVTN